ncbi:lactonase family protein [Microbacterium sp. EYE_5]|uniref:lactonase family protein n=1 Tax=unclassified Microbacterium TaxID=2609290 RepID=UPI002005863C|nr:MULTISPECIES: beta-propeller fold lactonase family protein [unclassified Microbacterium]MCK6079640.1 lactonase family protein [Microbacterium sp. EYE_382]MCK6084911.1 lactonase family protein [Microbacterium sp. EYE_384]MCK6122863.1 lactonase family protein [Microbacterium sp. EYE_80]MCK6125674.1 lactonase family protein [Microbacterium sp. EYE_79]MCK6140595.1 lactonase family protein [Microbacterium sp. EYE_39]
MRFLLGGYSADMDGSATGIGLLDAGGVDSPLAGGPLGFGGDVVAAASPSWVAGHPILDVVYAALEGRGAVRAYRRSGDRTFVPLGDEVAVGDSPCHVLALADRLIVSCYGDGAVVQVALAADGRPVRAWSWTAADEPVLDDAAAVRALRAVAGEEFAHLLPEVDEAPKTDAVAGRPSHAHQAAALPGGIIATTDLGLDLVRFWRDGRERQRLALPPGTGPRHMRWHPSGHLYVLTEYSDEVFALAPDAEGRFRMVGGAQVGVLPDDRAAELAMSHDAEFLYAGLRGSDTIAVVRVRGAGETLQPVALAETGTRVPRHHVVVRDTLLVAGQQADEVVSLPLDLRTGAPGRVRHRTAAPTPTMLLPFPSR